MGLLDLLKSRTKSQLEQNKLKSSNTQWGTQNITQLPVTQDSDDNYITLQPLTLSRKLELGRLDADDADSYISIEFEDMLDQLFHESKTLILEAYLDSSSVFQNYFSNNSKQTSTHFGNSEAPYIFDTELAMVRTSFDRNEHVVGKISFNTNSELEIDIRGNDKINYTVSSMSGVLYFLSSMNLFERRNIIPDTFIKYINNKIVPTKYTDFNLPNMFYLFLVLNADLGLNSDNKPIYLYTPEPLKETLIKEVMDMYLTYFTLTTNTFELNKDEDIFLRNKYNEEEKKKENKVSGFHLPDSYFNIRIPSYCDFDLTLLPKTRFLEKYKQYMGYKMFYILLNYVPEKQDFEDSKTFRDLWVLSKTTTGKIDNILDTLFKAHMDNNKPSEDVLNKTINVLNTHLDTLLNTFEESITEVNAEITKPSINTQRLDRKVEALLEDL